MHEVIVVGAGPAGSTAALALARAGRDVLLLDRVPFPRDKVCGDGVPHNTLALLDDLGLGPQIARAGFYTVNRLRLVSPNGTVYESPLRPYESGRYESCVIPRTKFDALVWEGACRAGAQFQVVQVTGAIVENGCVTGVRVRDGAERELRAPIVIAADGATSVIARALHRRKPDDQHRAVSLRAYVDGMQAEDHMVEFYLYKEILPGYSWIFTTNDGVTNIGTGMRLDIFRKIKGNLQEYLDHFMRMPLIAARMRGARLREVQSWQLPLGSDNFSRAFDGAMLTGDAGSFIDPLTGGGIHHAVVTGHLAAQTAVEALQAGDFSRKFLARFDDRWRKELWGGLRKSFWVQRVLVASPWVADLLLARLAKWKWGIEPFLNKM